MELREHIRKVLMEYDDSQEEKVRELINNVGLDNTVKMLGGYENIIKLGYDGDIKKFAELNGIRLVYINEVAESSNMYIHNSLVQRLNLESYVSSDKELKLGKFTFSRGKNGTKYSFNARLYPLLVNGVLHYWRVVGMSGTSGFGYSFISKKETLGKTFRRQIFNQIIDKYDLAKYM